MLIYRLESNSIAGNSGSHVMLGAYQTRSQLPYLEAIANIALGHNNTGVSNDHPQIENDNPERNLWGSNYQDYIFAFDSLDSLYNWFNDSERMKDLEFQDIAQIGVYSVREDHIIRASKQLIALSMECHFVRAERVYRA